MNQPSQLNSPTWIDVADPKSSNGVKFDIVQFPGGEIHPRVGPVGSVEYFIDQHGIDLSVQGNVQSLLVVARLRTANDLLALLMLLAPSGALATGGWIAPTIVIPYLPYARQDRYTAPGEAIATNVIAHLLTLYTSRIVTIDPHSNAIINALSDKIAVDVLSTYGPSREFVENMMMKHGANPGDRLVLIAPDEGAMKRTQRLASRLQEYVDKHRAADSKDFDYIVEVWLASKKRDVRTGHITGVALNCEPVRHGVQTFIFVFDDICDGGRTFTELAKEVDKTDYATARRFLFVTHGIFSKGLDPLLDVYEDIGTVDSFRSIAEYAELYPEHNDVNTRHFHAIPFVENCYNRESA